MIGYIKIDDMHKWDCLVMSFSEYDVYYLSGYVKTLQVHGDGEPVLFYYESDKLKGLCVFMKRIISEISYFHNEPKFDHYTDLITPYGYGGFIFEGDINDKTITSFKTEFTKLLEKEKIVSVFIRFHPQLRNAEFVRSIFDVLDIGRTIEIDTSSHDTIWDNITSKNRNVIRKAQKSGVEIKHGKGIDLLLKFKDIYDKTMKRDDAEPYYFFKKEFYEILDVAMKQNYEIFYAIYDGNIISMAIILFANNRMHYHLSGSLFEYRSLAASNLMLYKAACWGQEEGFKSFHLGGGLGSKEDNLFKFKAAFNRNSDLKFSIGKLVADNEVYQQLVDIRSELDPSFNIKSNFFPLYRS